MIKKVLNWFSEKNKSKIFLEDEELGKTVNGKYRNLLESTEGCSGLKVYIIPYVITSKKTSETMFGVKMYFNESSKWEVLDENELRNLYEFCLELNFTSMSQILTNYVSTRPDLRRAMSRKISEEIKEFEEDPNE